MYRPLTDLCSVWTERICGKKRVKWPAQLYLYDDRIEGVRRPHTPVGTLLRARTLNIGKDDWHDPLVTFAFYDNPKYTQWLFAFTNSALGNSVVD